MAAYVKRFADIDSNCIAEVGNKIASVGEMYKYGSAYSLAVPDGFCVTTTAYRDFITYNNLEEKLKATLETLDVENFSNLEEVGAAARRLINKSKFPVAIETAIVDAYSTQLACAEPHVAVRSSAFITGALNVKFQGLHDAFLNITGPIALMYAIKCCYASLYSNNAIKHLVENGLDHSLVSMAVGIQQMVRSDLACSGIGSATCKTNGETIIDISGTWGLGGYISRGLVSPDEFTIAPDTMQGGQVILQKKLGSKSHMLVCNEQAAGTNSTSDKTTPRELRAQFVLADEELLLLSEQVLHIVNHYGRQSITFEWAKDGNDGKLYLLEVNLPMAYPVNP